MAGPVHWYSTTMTGLRRGWRDRSTGRRPPSPSCAPKAAPSLAPWPYPPAFLEVSLYDRRVPPPPSPVQPRGCATVYFFTIVVPEEGLELSCPCGRRILSPLRLPVPPFRP